MIIFMMPALVIAEQESRLYLQLKVLNYVLHFMSENQPRLSTHGRRLPGLPGCVQNEIVHTSGNKVCDNSGIVLYEAREN